MRRKLHRLEVRRGARVPRAASAHDPDLLTFELMIGLSQSADRTLSIPEITARIAVDARAARRVLLPLIRSGLVGASGTARFGLLRPPEQIRITEFLSAPVARPGVCGPRTLSPWDRIQRGIYTALHDLSLSDLARLGSGSHATE